MTPCEANAGAHQKVRSCVFCGEGSCAATDPLAQNHQPGKGQHQQGKQPCRSRIACVGGGGAHQAWGLCLIPAYPQIGENEPEKGADSNFVSSSKKIVLPKKVSRRRRLFNISHKLGRFTNRGECATLTPEHSGQNGCTRHPSWLWTDRCCRYGSAQKSGRKSINAARYVFRWTWWSGSVCRSRRCPNCSSGFVASISMIFSSAAEWSWPVRC